MTKHNTRITALNILTGPWHLYRPIDFIVQISFKFTVYIKFIDGMRENWHHITMIIWDWTSVKTIKNSLHFIFFKILLNNFYLVLMENESIGVEHLNEMSIVTRMCTKSHKVEMWLMIEGLAFESIFKFCCDQPLTSCQPVSKIVVMSGGR